MFFYTLVICWSNGDKETHDYGDEDEAIKAGEGYKKAFGRQVEWWEVIKREV